MIKPTPTILLGRSISIKENKFGRTGWKAAFIVMKNKKKGEEVYVVHPVILQLYIPKGALITETTKKYLEHGCVKEKKDDHAKHRCSKAFVRAIWAHDILNNNKITEYKNVKEARSYYSWGFIYRIHEEVVPEVEFSENLAECGSGIHFFDKLEDAVSYGVYSYYSNGELLTDCINRVDRFKRDCRCGKKKDKK